MTKFASLPVGYTVYFKECYENLALILSKLSYNDFGWNIWCNLKVH